MLVFRKILRTYLMDGPNSYSDSANFCTKKVIFTIFTKEEARRTEFDIPLVWKIILLIFPGAFLAAVIDEKAKVLINSGSYPEIF